MKLLVRALLLLCLFRFTNLQAFTLQDLQNDAQLNPQRFMSYFSDFSFSLGEKLQSPDQFLARKCGDCDDFSTLAVNLLAAKGYQTQLIVISMDAGVHAVCYVAQEHVYLDYNNRATRTLVATDGSLSDIAQKVAGSFRSTWRSASEYQIADGARRCLRTELR